MTDHPRDEFDDVPESSARQGVHREQLLPGQSGGLGLKITVGVLALLIGLGAYFLLPRLGLTAGGGEPTTTSSAEPTASEDAREDESASAPADATGGPGSSAGATDGPDASGEQDRTQTVNVLNGTGVPGLASVAAGRLSSAGWTSVVPGNWAGAPLDSSVVFYNGEAQRPSAEAVAEDLGISDLVDTAEVSPGISVVLGPEFQ